MELEQVVAAVEGRPLMTPDQGRRLYEHVRESRPDRILEIGTHHGVSAAYMAAALAANGSGRLTTVDHHGLEFAGAREFLTELGLGDRVEVVYVPDSSYNWWLRERVAERSDADGNVTPLYDLCFLDGAHSFSVDATAAILVEKLLKPGGWLLLDDLDWTFGEWEDDKFDTELVTYKFSDDELKRPHVREIWNLIVKPHPSFTEFREVDGWWGWARKDPTSTQRTLRLETEEQLSRTILRNLREAKTRARHLLTRN